MKKREPRARRGVSRMNVLVIASLMVAVVFYGLARTLEFFVRKMKRMGSSRVFYLDPDSMTYDEKWDRVANGNEVEDSKRKRTNLLLGAARWTHRKTGSGLWLVHARHGVNLKSDESLPGDNLVGPTDKAVFSASPKLRVLTVWGPETYFQATKKNDARDTLNANADEEHWAIKLAPLAFIALLLLLLMVGFLVYKMGKLGTAATGGAS